MADTDQSAEPLHFRIRREASGAVAWFRESWRAKRWFRWTAIALLALAVLSIALPAIRAARKPRDKRASLEESVLPTSSIRQIEHARDELAQDPELLTSTVRNVEKKPENKSARRTRRTQKENEK